MTEQTLEALVSSFEGTLRSVATALQVSFGPTAQWGLAGLREETFVFLFAETLRATSQLSVAYEPSLADRCRSDLAWNGYLLEAKWWWWNSVRTVDAILDNIDAKSSFAAHSAIKLALLITVDENVSTPNGWCAAAAAAQMTPGITSRWQLVGCATATSPYVGVSVSEPKIAKARTDGLLAAALYRRRDT